MTVAILCPTHNRADLLPEMVASCLRQTDPDWELFVLDDGSTDNTRDVLCGIRDSRINYRWFPKHEANEPGVRNALFEWWQSEHTLDLACWLDSDDLMHPERIQVQREYMEANPSCDVSFTSLAWFTDANIETARAGGFLEPFFKPEPSMYGLNLAGYRGNLTLPTAMFRPSIRAVKWDERMIHGGADLLWVFTMANNGYKIGAVPRQLYYLRNHPERLTIKRRAMSAEALKPDLDHFYAEIARMGGVR